MTVHSVHGAYNFLGGGVVSTDRLRPFFESAGYGFIEHDYGFFGLFMAGFLNEREAIRLTKKVHPGDIGVGHSNGCDILLRAARMGAPFSQLVLINPALDAETEFPPEIDYVHVWHSPSDRPVQIAKLLPWHHWGSMGAVGYTGINPKIVNYDKENDFRVSSCTHSDIFNPDKLAYFGPLMVERVKMHDKTKG